VVAVAFIAMQIGRTVFAIVALRGEALQRTFTRLLVWNIAIGCLWLLGALWPPQIREVVWALAIGVDLLGAAVGFYTPAWAGPGRQSGPSRAICSLNAARPSSCSPLVSPSS